MSPLDKHREAIAHPPIEYRPELRWWLAEGLHTDATLRREIDTAHRLGFGGMEFLAMDEGDIDHARYGWGSEEWVHDSGIVVAETTARNMSVSFTSGTNWSNANLPTIDPDHPAAAQELNVEVEDVAERRGGALPRIDLTAERGGSMVPGHRIPPTRQHLVAVIAAPTSDGTAFDVADTVDLTAQVIDEALEWTAPDARRWRLFVFWSHGTGQTASPSASVNYTVNYLDRAGVDAVIDYWRDVVLTAELRAEIDKNPRAQMYMDSLELNTWGAGGMFWGRSAADEFRARRGYDIAPWLPFLVRRTGMFAATTVYTYEPDEAHRIEVEKVRFDYVRTLTDLYIENMLRPFAAFLHENGLLLRAEISYGLPFELTRPGPEVDGIETESLEFASQIDAYRMLAGPAHLFGKQYSSETGATTRNHMLDHRFYDQIINTQLAAGITKTVLHGWASRAGGEHVTEWPGHEGMWPLFSERFDSRQPGSEFYPQWNEAIGRYQYLLRQGRPRVDVGILRTDHFIDNLLGVSPFDADGARIPDEDAYGRLWMRNRENQWWQDLGMQDAGWTYEFFDGSLLLRSEVNFDGTLVQPDGPGYQALIVYQEALDADVAALLLDWARKGLRLLIVNGTRELKVQLEGSTTFTERAAVRTPGLDGRDAELADTLAALRALPNVGEVAEPAGTIAALRELGVIGRAEFGAPDPNILTHLREDGDLLHLYAYHFLYESGEQTTVELRTPGEGAVHRIDVWSGSIHPHPGVSYAGGRTRIGVTLAPGETALFTIDRSVAAAASAPAAPVEITALADWAVTVESWDAGEKELIVEDRGLGYETREVLPHTAVTRIPVPGGDLRPWTELEGVGAEISGIAEYVTTFAVDAVDNASSRYLLDLGSTSGGLGSVVVNGGPARGFDTSRPLVDITEDIVVGENTVKVRVSSSLNNRLIARGYYAQLPDVALDAVGLEGYQTTRVREHGLVGPVRLIAVDR
ncbi:glycosyl hydrolase [Microbacterium sp. NPDC055903]